MLKRWTLLVAIAGEVVGCMGEKNKEKDKEAVRNKKVKKRQKIKKTEMKTNWNEKTEKGRIPGHHGGSLLYVADLLGPCPHIKILNRGGSLKICDQEIKIFYTNR